MLETTALDKIILQNKKKKNKKQLKWSRLLSKCGANVGDHCLKQNYPLIKKQKQNWSDIGYFQKVIWLKKVRQKHLKWSQTMCGCFKVTQYVQQRNSSLWVTWKKGRTKIRYEKYLLVCQHIKPLQNGKYHWPG